MLKYVGLTLAKKLTMNLLWLAATSSALDVGLVSGTRFWL